MNTSTTQRGFISYIRKEKICNANFIHFQCEAKTINQDLFIDLWLKND